jgi:glycosyltransferase involved in cell wall biosynthesis
LISALLKDLAPDTPVMAQCHATGIRQMTLCPHLADDVIGGCSRIDAFAVLHGDHATQLEQILAVPGSRIHRVGAGYREDLFFAPEADALRARMDLMAPSVIQHGQLDQPELAEVARRSTVCVLPSFYEGLPLVLVEALACGCRLVATRLPGVLEELAPRLGETLELVDLPRLEAIDRPHPADLPVFVDSLESAIETALDATPIGDPKKTLAAALEHFSWKSVFRRVEAVWTSLV